MNSHPPSTETVPADGRLPQTELRWTVHPLRDEPGSKSALLVGIILVLTAGIWISFHSSGYGFLTFGLLTGAMSRYFLPTRYALAPQGIAISHLGVKRRVPWAQFRRATRHADGVFLSPFSRPNRLDTFRGYFLRFANNGDEVMHGIQIYLPAHAV